MAMRSAAEGKMKGVLEYNEDLTVSVDYNGNPHSSIFDSTQTAVADDGRQLAADLTNPDLSHGEILLLRGHTLRLARRLALGPSELTEVLSAESFGSAPHELLLSWRYFADFADVFEVRGMVRERRGELLPAVIEAGAVRLSYRGLDSILRTTTLRFDPPPEKVGS